LDSPRLHAPHYSLGVLREQWSGLRAVTGVNEPWGGGLIPGDFCEISTEALTADRWRRLEGNKE